MVRCTIFQFIVLLVTWRNNTVLGVTLSVAETTCVGNNITLKCSVNSFTSATWSRNGSTALSTCTSSAFCTTDDTTINGIKYSFTGNPSGTQVSFQLQLVENGIEWVCNFNAIPYVYKFDVSEECATSTTTTQSNTTLKPTQSCGFNGCIWFFLALGLLVVILICLCCYCNKKRSKDRGRRPDKDENVTFSSKTAEKTEKSAHKLKSKSNVTGTSVDTK